MILSRLFACSGVAQDVMLAVLMFFGALLGFRLELRLLPRIAKFAGMIQALAMALLLGACREPIFLN